MKIKDIVISLIAIILGLIIIIFPILGVVATGGIVGLSILLMGIYLLVAGTGIMYHNTSGAIIDIFLGIIMLIISLGIIFNPSLFAFLSVITMYLAGIFLIVVGVVTLISNRDSRYGFWGGIIGVILGLIYIIIGSYIINPIILGTLIGLWLIISGIFGVLDR